jgi:predicted MPP superfamily phosphohydrolase
LDQNLKNANANKLNDNNFNILVTHQPISLEKLKDYPVDLEVA